MRAPHRSIVSKTDQQSEHETAGWLSPAFYCLFVCLFVCLFLAIRALYGADSKFQAEINRENPLGFHGTLALSFAVLLRQLWSGKREAIEPSRLKQLLGASPSFFFLFFLFFFGSLR